MYEKKVKKIVQNTYEQETVGEVKSFPCLALPQRGLTKQSAERWGIRSSLNPKDGKTIAKTYFPSKNQEGVITGYHTRDWTLPKEHDFHFGVVGVSRVSNKLFGQEEVLKTRKKRLYIVEGQEEVAATRECLYQAMKPEWRYKADEAAIVSVAFGTKNAAEHIAQNIEFVLGYEEVVLAFDADEATAKELSKGIMKGKEATEEVAGGVLAQANVLVVERPAGCKDSRQALMEGKGSEMGRLLLWECKPYVPEKIEAGDESDLDELLNPLETGHHLPEYPKLSRMIGDWRVGNELIVWTAFSGVGKTTAMRNVAWRLNKSTNRKSGYIFLEEPTKKTKQALLALELGIPLPLFRQDPLKYTTREQAEQASKQVLTNGRTFFLNHFGSIKVDRLMQQINFLHFVCGCDEIFLDHVSMVVAGSQSNNERKDLDVLFERLASFMAAYPVTIQAVVHLKRVDTEKKLKPGEEPEPYWREIKKEYLRGSAGIEQMSSIIIAVEDQVMPDSTRGLIRSKVLKNREWQTLGICDTMKVDDKGRLVSIPDEGAIF